MSVGTIWTAMPLQQLARRLADRGFQVAASTLAELLHGRLKLGRRKIQKQKPLGQSKDRGPQFERLAQLRAEYASEGWPIISVDTKRKELLGRYAHAGQAWTDGQLQAFDHDFGSYSNGKAIPYGIYDTARNEALIYLAIGSDTAELAADALRRWWYRLGKRVYGGAGGLLVLADCGGSNGYKVSLYRERLSHLATEIGMAIRVAHLPPYCSKYTPIDHRLFCHLRCSFNGRMCESLGWLQLVYSRVTTQSGLKVVAELSRKIYQAGQKASDAFKLCEPTIRDATLGKYNYVLPAAN